MPIIEVPGYGDVEFPDSMTDDQITAAIRTNMLHAQPKPPVTNESPAGLVPLSGGSFANQRGQEVALPTQAPREKSFTDKLKADAGFMWRAGATPIIRGAYNAATAIPGLAADAGVGLRNLVTGDNLEAPTVSAQREMNRILPLAGVPGDKSIELGTSLLLGAKLPAPQVKNPAPAGFANARQQARDAVLQKGQAEGYVVPPSANNPSFGNRLLEGIAGKQKVGQEAAIRNQPVTDALVARSLGQNPDSPVTQGALQVIRSEAHKAGYEPVKAVGEIVTDKQFIDDLAKITQAGSNASRSFPGLKAASPIDDVVQALTKPKFDSADGIDAIRYLRELADSAYGSGNSALGKQYKAASKAIEDVIERGLSARGQNGSALLKAFKEARQLIAQTHTAGKALTDDAGSSNARTYAQELLKGKPLVGDQRLIGQFASSFGKYTPKPTGENFPALSPLDVYGSAGVSAAADSAIPLMYPLTRAGLREYLLSSAGQARAFSPQVVPRQTMGLFGSIPIAANEYNELLAQ